MGLLQVEQYDSEEIQKEKAKEDMIKQRVILSSLKKSGDVARFCFLRDLDPMITALYHFEFNESEPAKTIRAICAREENLPCQHCAQYAKNTKVYRDLRASQFIALPIWVHNFTNPTADETGYKSEDLGYRILFLRRTSDAVGQIRAYHSTVGTICGTDWHFRRTGTGRDSTKYTMTAYPGQPIDLRPNQEPVAYEDVMRALIEAYPMAIAGH